MSRLHLVTMPKWGLSMEEGMVVAWHKQVGDAVAPGEDLIDVETTKITNTIEAPVAGCLLKTLVAPGETAVCGAALAIIGPADMAQEEIEQCVADLATPESRTALATAPTAEPVIAEVKSDGAPMRIRYLDTGEGPQTLVLIHGFGGSLENWMFNQPALSTDMRVIAIDLPGHGGSDKRVADGSANALAAIVAHLLDDIAPGPVHLVAHSFGAMVARALATTRPDRIATLTAIAPADLGTISRAYIDGFIGARRRSEMSAAISLLFAKPDLATRDMAEALLRYKRLDGVDHALRAIDTANFAEPGPDPAAAAFWAQLGPRGLLIWGEQDAVIPLGSAQLSSTGIQTQIIGDAGHMPHLEKAEAVNAAIAHHVAKNAAGQP